MLQDNLMMFLYLVDSVKNATWSDVWPWLYYFGIFVLIYLIF